jgi:hypothetical protein
MKLKTSKDGRIYVVVKGRKRFMPADMTKKQFKKYITALKKKKTKKRKQKRRSGISQRQNVKQIVHVDSGSSKEPTIVQSPPRDNDLQTLIGSLINKLQQNGTPQPRKPQRVPPLPAPQMRANADVNPQTITTTNLVG